MSRCNKIFIVESIEQETNKTLSDDRIQIDNAHHMTMYVS